MSSLYQYTLSEILYDPHGNDVGSAIVEGFSAFTAWEVVREASHNYDIDSWPNFYVEYSSTHDECVRFISLDDFMNGETRWEAL